MVNILNNFPYRLSYIPNWLKIPNHVKNEIKFFIQRGTRGYSDRDVWSLDYFMSVTIGSALVSMSENIHGAPGGYPNFNNTDGETDFALWQSDLKRYGEALLKYSTMDDESEEHYNSVMSDVREAMEFISLWFPSLWT